MDPVQRGFQQALALWRGLGRSQRVGLVVVGAAIVGLLLTVATVGRGPDMAVAFTGLSDQDAAAVVAKLKEAKIPYELGSQGTVRVPGGMVNDVKVMMAGQGLGGKPAAGSGFELFNQPAFGQTEFAQKVNYQRALEAELARSIDRMEAVDSARVHLVLPQPTLFASQEKEPTASVILKLKPGRRFDPAQVRSVVALVTGSVEGLKPQNVSVVDVNGTILSEEASLAGPEGLTSKQLDAQRSYESSMERNLQALLDSVLGPGKSQVRVSAQLDWNRVEETSETYTPIDPNAPAPLKSSREYTERQAPGAGTQPGGVPGPASNNGAVPTYQGTQTPAGSGQGGYEKTQKDTTYETSKTVQKIVRSPGAVKRLTVSVVYDRAILDQIPDAKTRIESALSNAAGLDQKRGDAIEAVDMPFNREQLNQARAAMDQAAQQDQIMSYARLAALALGPIALLLVLWLLLGRPGPRKKGAAADSAAPVALPAVADRPAAPASPKPVQRPIGEDPQKVYIREQITTLAKTNPTTVAHLIQTWMDEDRRN